MSRGLKRPYHLIDKGLKPSGVFVRHGVSSVPATDEAIREMIRDSDGTAFDKMRSTNQELTFQYAQDFFSKSRLEFDEVHKHTLGLIDGTATTPIPPCCSQTNAAISSAAPSTRGRGKTSSRRARSSPVPF